MLIRLSLYIILGLFGEMIKNEARFKTVVYTSISYVGIYWLYPWIHHTICHTAVGNWPEVIQSHVCALARAFCSPIELGEILLILFGYLFEVVRLLLERAIHHGLP